ncbi:MAG TPA: lipopolysaccharide heptosyltransferase II [Burkholderiaceae bacterium]|nr:lipopolysaccharide heptosyltransferase II [Burkholderiaceae bacterium]
MIDWAHAQNVLCIRLDNLGDVLMTTPAIRAVKHARPGRRVTLLASKAGAQAARHVPEIDDVIAYDAPWVKHEHDAGRAIDLEMIETLRKQRFDAAIIFTVYTQTALPAAMMCRLAGIPLRLAHSRENPYRLLSDWVAESEPQQLVRHEVERQLDLVAAIGCTTQERRLSFRVTTDDRRRVVARLAKLGIDASRPWILMHPGATAASRRYPVEQFAQAARGIAEQLDCPVVFGGTSNERNLVNEVRARMGAASYSLAGELNLGECAAAISLARVLVSNNSGPVHIAAALNTPVVDLYALTNPQHTPWLVRSHVLSHDVPCKYCFKSVCPEGHHDCLRKVAPQEVVDACLALFEPKRTVMPLVPVE